MRVSIVSNAAHFGIERFLGFTPSVDLLIKEIGVSHAISANCVIELLYTNIKDRHNQI